MRLFIFMLHLFVVQLTFAQPNCEAFKYYGDMLKYKACKKAENIRGHYQFSKTYQSILDEAIAIDSTYDYAYWAKSIAYLKSGDFLTWKKLIDKAVELSPKDHLGYRGWCRYQFFRDYEGAINDIEQLDSLVNYDIGHSQNGTYHLNIAKALCLKAIGKKKEAIQVMEAQIKLNEADDFVGALDYLHLGVLYLETEQFEKALIAFEKQSKVNEIADNQYYKAIANKYLNNLEQYRTSLHKSKELFESGHVMSDPYSTPLDKVFLYDIEIELDKIDNDRQ